MAASLVQADTLRRTGNIGPGEFNDPHKYDYLMHKYRIPVVLCIADDQCAPDIIESKNLSDTDCDIHAWQTVQQFVKDHGYERWTEVHKCIR